MSSRPEPSSRIQACVVALLLSAYAGLAIWNAATTSPTADEPVHLAAGYSALAGGDYRLNPEHPPLVKMIAAIPTVLSGQYAMDREGGAPTSVTADATRSNALLSRDWSALLASGANWRFVHEFFYGVRDDVLARSGAERAYTLPTDVRYRSSDFLHPAQRLFLESRITVLGLALALGLFIFLWARELFGFLPAVLALTIFCFDPNFVAHGALVTTDVPAAMGIFASVWLYVRALRLGRWRDFGLFGLATGVAAIVKFSTVMLAPMLLLLSATWLAFPAVFDVDSIGRKMRMQRTVKALAVGAISAYVGIWAIYGFRFSAAAAPTQAAAFEEATGIAVPFREPGHLPIEWALRKAAVIRTQVQGWERFESPQDLAQRASAVSLPLPDRLILELRDRQILPESYLMGLAYVRLSVRRGAFLDGEYSPSGFWDYFIRAFLYKTSIPVLILVVVAVSGLTRDRRRESLFLIVPAIFYFVVASVSGLNIGIRHILPIYPFLFVAIGYLVTKWPEQKRRTGVIVIGVLVAIPCFVVFTPLPGVPVAPHHLSFFNEFAGGPTGGVRHLVDSNCDWGQDLPELAKWVKEHELKRPIRLSYFGSGDPRAFGFEYVDVSAGDPRQLSGLVAISVMNRIGDFWAPRREAWQEALSGAELVGRAGYSIEIYRLRTGLDKNRGGEAPDRR